MPSEDQQRAAKLEQPWKQWHTDLDPMSLPDVREGTLVLQRGGDNSGNHGTTALQKQTFDLNVPKEKPEVKVS